MMNALPTTLFENPLSDNSFNLLQHFRQSTKGLTHCKYLLTSYNEKHNTLHTGPHFLCFREFNHLTRDLSQAEKKISVVTSWATHKMTTSKPNPNIYIGSVQLFTQDVQIANQLLWKT